MKKQQLYKHAVFGLYVLCFVTVFAVSMLVSYSQGDDAIFLKLASENDIWGFIRKCNSARLSKAITLYVVMNVDIMGWRIVNAAVFTLFFRIIGKIVFLVTNVSNRKEQFFIRFILLVSICFAHVSVIGFTVFWVTGTQDYLWPLTFGMMSLLPGIESIFGKRITAYKFGAAVVFACWGGLGQEQVSFMLLMIEALLFVLREKKNRNNEKQITGQWYGRAMLFIRIACFIFLIFAPMNQKRMGDTYGYAEFFELSEIQHLFLTTQWEMSAFANELKLLLIAIWLILSVILYDRKRKKETAAALFMVAGMFVFQNMGVVTLTDMGIDVENIKNATEQVLFFNEMSGPYRFAYIWQMVSIMIVTPYLLRKDKICCFVYTIGVCLPLMMIVSASMYISGGRVFFTSSVLFSGVIGMLLSKAPVKNYLPLTGAAAVLLGVYEIAMDFEYLLEHLW